MIPRIKVRTEIPYLINAWGKEDENNSSIYKLWRTLSTSLFLFKQPMNQPYVTTGCKTLSLLNFLLYWKARSLKTKPLQFPSRGCTFAGSAAGWRCCQEPQLSCQQPGPCSGLLLSRAITNTFLCQVTSTPAQFPSAAHHKCLGQHRGENKQLVAEGGQRCCSFLLPEPA